MILIGLITIQVFRNYSEMWRMFELKNKCKQLTLTIQYKLILNGQSHTVSLDLIGSECIWKCNEVGNRGKIVVCFNECFVS